ncbi:hypothetical protein PR202_ga12338 [Eleusine coracana subsp. coracana]|uniref:Fe2OG dioxygenase domain-containing protein n=1 Tax=Eleusine coracana subsp. coracana TaxID=191504 RepID=A0AAV5CBP0_ELECO|nr:hypothetical protein PR202_ga12338 [Eleusine coracana subsp. coracana]
MANNMLHLTPPHREVPGCYAFPAEKIQLGTSAAAVSLPVVDISRSRDEVCRAILDAGKEMGFFQASHIVKPRPVVNHGVPDQVMRDMESVCVEFFRLPAEDKAALYSEDPRKTNRLFCGALYGNSGEKYWRDCLRLACTFPVGKSTEDWPGNPQRFPYVYLRRSEIMDANLKFISFVATKHAYREVAEKFTVLTRGLGMELLRLLCQSLELRHDYFEGDLSGSDVILHVNHYPPCPDPSVTLGLPPHCDRGLITLLHPGTVPGLEIAYKGNWIKVEPLPNAFIVNFGLQLEVVTNGLLKSIEHRAMTNVARARTSVATFIMPTQACLVGPAGEFLSEDNPPRYRTMTYGEFSRGYAAVNMGSSPLHINTDLKNIQKI